MYCAHHPADLCHRGQSQSAPCSPITPSWLRSNKPTPHHSVGLQPASDVVSLRISLFVSVPHGIAAPQRNLASCHFSSVCCAHLPAPDLCHCGCSQSALCSPIFPSMQRSNKPTPRRGGIQFSLSVRHPALPCCPASLSFTALLDCPAPSRHNALPHCIVLPRLVPVTQPTVLHHPALSLFPAPQHPPYCNVSFLTLQCDAPPLRNTSFFDVVLQ